MSRVYIERVNFAKATQVHGSLCCSHLVSTVTQRFHRLCNVKASNVSPMATMDALEYHKACQLVELESKTRISIMQASIWSLEPHA